MKWILLIGLIWAGPPTKVTSPDEVKIKESFSVASLGVEAEAFRIQTMQLQGKSTYMVAKLVNGNLSIEKAISAEEYQKLKNIVQPLTSMASSEDCKIPMTVTFLTSSNKDQIKLCSEKPQVSGPAKKFAKQAKPLLGPDEEH